MTPGRPVAPGVFCLVNRGPFARPPWQVTDWSDIASCADRGFWRRWHAGALRPPGRRTSPRGKHLPCRHPGRQLDWLLPARLDRPIHAQSHGDFPGLARAHRRRFFRRIERILPHLDEMVEGGLITLEKVRVILYRAAKK